MFRVGTSIGCRCGSCRRHASPGLVPHSRPEPAWRFRNQRAVASGHLSLRPEQHVPERRQSQLDRRGECAVEVRLLDPGNPTCLRQAVHPLCGETAR